MSNKANAQAAIREKLAKGQKVSVQDKIDADYPLTWQEKLDNGLPLTSLEDTQADADFNYRERLENEKRRKEYEERKRLGERPSGADSAHKQVDNPPEDEVDDVPNMDWSRESLNDYAEGLGIENPQELANKQAVVDAINEKGGN